VATQPYRNAAGERRPGTTWVLGQNLGWNKDALMGWANREGLAGRSIKESRTATASRAANVGTACHTMIEAHILGQEPKLVAADQLSALVCDEDRTKAKQGFTSFFRWYQASSLQIIATEVFGVNEEYQTGFCADALAIEVDESGKRSFTLLDWKSSKGTYADHLIQVAAYTYFIEAMLTEWYAEPIILTGAHVVRVGKDNGNFSHKFWDRTVLEQGWRVFSWLRAIHEQRWALEAHVR
jgi:hypothetical protein